MSDFDNPWKEALDQYFEAFLAFFFPWIHHDIDWSRGYETLDKELQQIVREGEEGTRVVDKLMKVWRNDGVEAWVLIHIEIQSQEESDFPRRMYVYNYRLFDCYQRTVVSLAVLGDDRPNWRPNRFENSLWRCRAGIEFPIVKLLDYAADLPALETNPNPFAAVVLAHLKTMETRQDPEARKTWKLRIVKGLFEQKFKGEDIRRLFKFIDWMMTLPAELNDSFWQEVHEFEEAKRMPYITSVERIGMEKGILETLEVVLEVRFGKQGLDFLEELRQVRDIEKLRSVVKALKTASTIDELRQAASGVSS